MTKQLISLREKFAQACDRTYWEKQHDENIEKGCNGTEQDFYDHFDKIATNLKAGLESLIEDINTGQRVVTNRYDTFSYVSGEPLHFEIIFPYSMSEEKRQKLMRDVYDIPAHHRIHEICSGKDIDMNVVTGLVYGNYKTASGERKGYHSITIRLEPFAPYFGPCSKPSSKKRATKSAQP